MKNKLMALILSKTHDCIFQDKRLKELIETVASKCSGQNFDREFDRFLKSKNTNNIASEFLNDEKDYVRLNFKLTGPDWKLKMIAKDEKFDILYTINEINDYKDEYKLIFLSKTKDGYLCVERNFDSNNLADAKTEFFKKSTAKTPKAALKDIIILDI